MKDVRERYEGLKFKQTHTVIVFSEKTFKTIFHPYLLTLLSIALEQFKETKSILPFERLCQADNCMGLDAPNDLSFYRSGVINRIS